jgi:SulP family sulfate permease
MTHLWHYIVRVGLAARGYNDLDFFPFKNAIRSYQAAYIGGDFRAGLNVALLAFPQGMAYASIAGLPIQYGIYGSAVAAITAPFFAKSSFITMGPTNATAVMLLSAFASLSIAGDEMISAVPILIFLVGIFIVIGAYFKVANLIQYISRSVITGYISAAALLIIANQIPKALGLKLENKGATFYESIIESIRCYDSLSLLTLTVSLTTLALHYILNRYFKALPNVAISLVSISIVAAFCVSGQDGVQFLNGIDASQWGLQMPNFSLENLQNLTGPALAIALLCILEGVSIGKSLAAKTGARINSNQAMYSIGMANIACAFTSGMPASGSLTRSTLSTNSGGKTVMASLLSGLIVLLGAFAVGPLTQYIPQATLAVLVIVIGLSLINRHAISIVTKATRSDAIVFSVTFISGLFFPLDSAIYIGVATSIILFLKKIATPEMVEYAFNQEGHLAQMEHTKERDMPEISIVHVEGALFFGAADLFQNQLRRICEDPNLKIVVLKMRNASNLDATGVIALEELVRHMNQKGRYLILSEVKKDINQVLLRSGLHAYIEDRNIFYDDPQNPTLSTAKALRRAKEHLGNTNATISIFVDAERDNQKKVEQAP